MNEIDWIKKLYREKTISDFTLSALKDWLEERGDKRLTAINHCKIFPNGNRFTVIYPRGTDMFYKETLRYCRKSLALKIAKYLIKHDPSDGKCCPSCNSKNGY